MAPNEGRNGKPIAQQKQQQLLPLHHQPLHDLFTPRHSSLGEYASVTLICLVR